MFIKSQYTIYSMRSLSKKELIITGATLGLIAYTMILSFTSQAISGTQTSRTVSNAGAVNTIGVSIYWDNSCSSVISSIDWGNLDPGSNKNVVGYIRNSGNLPSILTMQTSNWNPSGAATYLSLSWDYDGQVLNPGEVVQVTFTLSISEMIEGITSFNFDITIIGSSY
jgi:hypothetical protein